MDNSHQSSKDNIVVDADQQEQQELPVIIEATPPQKYGATLDQSTLNISRNKESDYLDYKPQQQQQNGNGSAMDLHTSRTLSSSGMVDTYMHNSNVFQIPVPKFIKDNERLNEYYEKFVPKFPSALKDRINPVTLVFKKRSKLQQQQHQCDGSRDGQCQGCAGCLRRYSTRSSAKKVRDQLALARLESPKTRGQFQPVSSSDPVLDELITEGEFERYFNLICKTKIKVLMSFAVVLQILMSVFNYMKEGGYLLRRDALYTTELVVTIVCALIIIPLPALASYVEVVYLQILLLTNNISRIFYIDVFPPYEPSYQIYLWVNFSVPTAKFWRACITGTIGVFALVIIRIINAYPPSVLHVIFSQGGSYMFYLVAAGFGARLNEITNRALFAELVRVCPHMPAQKTYDHFDKFYKRATNFLTQRFKDREMERGFIQFYSSESIIEVGVVLATTATTIFYTMQDYLYSKPGTLFIFLLLRFIIMVPVTLSMLYLSVMRRTHPYRADLLSFIAFTVLIGVQCAMFTQTSTRDGSLYYFGGVMRVVTLASSQLFFLYLLVLLPVSFAILPLAMVGKGTANTNYILFFIIFTVIIACYSLLREKNQRVRYLIRHYSRDILTPELAKELDTEVRHVTEQEPSVDKLHLIEPTFNDGDDGGGVEMVTISSDLPSTSPQRVDEEGAQGQGHGVNDSVSRRGVKINLLHYTNAQQQQAQ
ncbi:hypothetical protein SAMD00019534_113410 [Acytostelium subglobosum LB1]|uniref:hypothetical protein n=1 Tax=Acytostelium subglobosum LB1 TaxID=1410327 RepID=UPI000645107D|nr:hypothetical protein SAMD00019534_113410 [Acytostelium subglobosum LB1]GAM28165.1 hypothetical protein SAMD00019534_113410 [Acytostelium subglobosum LB1]|eukprot:XP_012748799.1 hypothetical protein SAMD00019534_113410 [Acytostelium subglobosum LB1]